MRRICHRQVAHAAAAEFHRGRDGGDSRVPGQGGVDAVRRRDAQRAAQGACGRLGSADGEAGQLAEAVRLIESSRPDENGAAGSGGGVGPEVPLAIQEAITARHVLRLSYRDRRDVTTTREIEPVAFAGTPTQWYLIAWCRLREGARAFRIDRIQAAVDTGEPAPRRSYGDVDTDIPNALVRRLDLAG